MPSQRSTKMSEYHKSVVLLALFVVLMYIYIQCSDGLDSVAPRYFKEPDTSNKVLVSSILSAALGLSSGAGKIIRDVKSGGNIGADIKGKTNEGVDEPVTLADQLSNSWFINGLHHLWPELRIISEESWPASEAVSPPSFGIVDVDPILDRELDIADLVVYVDPLDATKEYTEDLLEYVTTMVCIVEKGRPVAAMIDRPFLEQTLWGVVGHSGLAGQVGGVDVQPRTGANADHGTGVITLSRSHTGDGLNVVEQHYPSYRSLPAGGAGYKAMLVVDGTADAYIHVTNIKAWDICAGDALIEAAGGLLTDQDGAPLVYEAADPVFRNGIVGALQDQPWFVERLHEEGTAERKVWLSELLSAGMDLAGQAGQVIKDVKAGNVLETDIKGQTNEGVDEPVTVADK
eukprot:Rmarinus@m.29850